MTEVAGGETGAPKHEVHSRGGKLLKAAPERGGEKPAFPRGFVRRLLAEEAALLTAPSVCGVWHPR